MSSLLSFPSLPVTSPVSAVKIKAKMPQNVFENYIKDGLFTYQQPFYLFLVTWVTALYIFASSVKCNFDHCQSIGFCLLFKHLGILPHCDIDLHACTL